MDGWMLPRNKHTDCIDLDVQYSLEEHKYFFL